MQSLYTQHYFEDQTQVKFPSIWKKETDFLKNEDALKQTKHNGKTYHLISAYQKEISRFELGKRSVILIAGVVCAVACFLYFSPFVAILPAYLSLLAATRAYKRLNWDDHIKRAVYVLNPPPRDCGSPETVEDLLRKEFYQKNKIETGFESLKVDIESLGVNLDEKGQCWERISDSVDEQVTITFQDALLHTIDLINKRLAKANGSSIQEKRRINLDGSKDPKINSYFHIVNDEYRDMLDEKAITQTWLFRIAKLLKDNNYIYDIVEIHGAGIIIQA